MKKTYSDSVKNDNCVNYDADTEKQESTVSGEDTIAAISSGISRSGIGVIRISGPDSRKTVEKIFRNKSGRSVKLTEPSHIYYGFIYNVSRETSDEVLVLNMPSPHSFTGEDVVEIDCHGGILMMKRVLESVISSGARHAEPGEFTKRAFLNGRLDLSQAEAVIDVINAGNDNAVRTSISQLRGGLSAEIKDIRSLLLEKTAFIEAVLDDPEHYSFEGFDSELEQSLSDISERLQRLISSYDRGRFIDNGIETAIVGRPNAGKSSLMNAVLGEERAIVTQIPGTTRDTITETVSVGNVMLRLTDTAGIRESSDEIERIGIDKALQNAENAELLMCVVDGTDTAEDVRGLVSFTASKKGKKIYIINKNDIANASDIKSLRELIESIDSEASGQDSIIELSAKTGDGLEALFEAVEKMFELGEIAGNDDIIITSQRHIELLRAAADSVKEVQNTMQMGLSEDFYSVDMMNAYRKLGEITGEETDEDLINEIFSKFCMGK